MPHPQIIATLMFALLPVTSVGAQESQDNPDPLAPFQILEGTWEGRSEGFGQTSNVTHEWKTILNGKFMRLSTRSVSKDKDGKETVREDVGYISWE